MIDNNEKIIGKITEEENRMFRYNQVCERAVNKVVLQAIKHFEMEEIEKEALWEAVYKKYNLDKDKVYRIENSTCELIEVPKRDEKLHKMVKRMENKFSIRKIIFEKFGLKP